MLQHMWLAAFCQEVQRAGHVDIRLDGVGIFWQANSEQESNHEVVSKGLSKHMGTLHGSSGK